MTHPLAAEITAWWGKHYQRPDSPEWQHFLSFYADAIHEKLAELATPHENQLGAEKVFGASGVGLCTRKAVYRWQGHGGHEIPGETAAVFFQGHILEAMAVASLQAMGWQLETQHPIERHPFATKADGLIIEAPNHPNLDHQLLSVKSAGFKGTWGKKVRGFAEIVEQGIKAGEPSYWAQAQLELWASNKQRLLFVVVAKDTLGGWPTWHTEIVERDDNFIARQQFVWNAVWSQRSVPYPVAAILNAESLIGQLIPQPGAVFKGWRDGENWKAEGRFNPCGTLERPCEFARRCRGEIR